MCLAAAWLCVRLVLLTCCLGLVGSSVPRFRFVCLLLLRVAAAGWLGCVIVAIPSPCAVCAGGLLLVGVSELAVFAAALLVRSDVVRPAPCFCIAGGWLLSSSWPHVG